jgi:glycosyltransferase involved in cell wall biosynthesis
MPKVGIVLAVHNGEKTIRRALRSVAEQTYRDFETILVDNNCVDNTLKIAEEFSKTANIRVVECKIPGHPAALNTGIHNCNSDYIARQDDDDYWYPDKLEKQVAFLDSNPEVGILGTRIRLVDLEGKEVALGTYGRPVIYPPDDQHIKNFLVMGQNAFCHSSIIMRKEVPLRAGGYSEHFPLAQDMHLWLKALPYFRFANLPEVLVDYTQAPTDWENQKYNPRVVKTLSSMYYQLYKMSGVIQGNRKEVVYDWEVEEFQKRQQD